MGFKDLTLDCFGKSKRYATGEFLEIISEQCGFEVMNRSLLLRLTDLGVVKTPSKEAVELDATTRLRNYYDGNDLASVLALLMTSEQLVGFGGKARYSGKNVYFSVAERIYKNGSYRRYFEGGFHDDVGFSNLVAEAVTVTVAEIVATNKKQKVECDTIIAWKVALLYCFFKRVFLKEFEPAEETASYARIRKLLLSNSSGAKVRIADVGEFHTQGIKAGDLIISHSLSSLAEGLNPDDDDYGKGLSYFHNLVGDYKSLVLQYNSVVASLFGIIHFNDTSAHVLSRLMLEYLPQNPEKRPTPAKLHQLADMLSALMVRY